MNTLLREAWTTAFPDPDGRHGPLPPILLLETLVTGLVDAFSYLALGHVFVANMTGNVVFAGFGIAGAKGFSLAASVLALTAFAAGAVVAGRVAHHRPGHRGRVLSTALLIQTAFIITAYVTALLAGAPYRTHTQYVLIVLLGIGMGIQNATARYLDVPDMSTTVLTRTITGIAADSRLAGGTGSHVGRRLLTAAAMLLGAFIGTITVLHSDPTVPLLIGAILLTGATIVSFSVARTGGPWTEPVTTPGAKPK